MICLKVKSNFIMNTFNFISWDGGTILTILGCYPLDDTS